MSPNQTFPKSARLRKQRDFDRVFAAKAFAADSILVVSGCSSELTHARLGLSVSRKVGNAVVRNRWKRAIRNAFRKDREQLPAGIDVVVRPRKGAVFSSGDIQRSLPQLCRKLEKRLNRR